jgi:hypothetical protein
MRSLLFRDVTRRRSVVNCRHFGSSYWSHLQESSSPSRFKMGPIVLKKIILDAFQQWTHQNQTHLFLPTFSSLSLLLLLLLLLLLFICLFLCYFFLTVIWNSSASVWQCFSFQVRHPRCVVPNYRYRKYIVKHYSISDFIKVYFLQCFVQRHVSLNETM